MLSQYRDKRDPHDRPFRPASARRNRFRRRGFSVVWLIVWVPLLLILSCLALDVANVWLARVELENGLEAAALAAVQDWAEGSEYDTLHARRVGVAYACQNRVRGCPIVIGTNYDPENDGVNQNDECCITPGDPPLGNLIFGAIDDSDPDYPVTFNAGLEAGCGGAGFVLFDVWGNRNLQADNCWGVAFIRTDNTPPDLRIKTIIINLRAGGGDGSFDSSPVLSSNAPGQWVVRDGSGGHSQPDIVGFTNTVIDGSSGQIQFHLDSPYELRIEFSADGTDDDGFEPCDRIRFGIDVRDVSKGKFGDDADGIGEDGVGITVVFERGTTEITRSATYVNRRNRFCRAEASFYRTCNYDPLDPTNYPGDLIVAPNPPPEIPIPPEFLPGIFPPSPPGPSGIPNLPCPAANGEKFNTGQSWVLMSAGAGRPFAVRAQARVCVPTLWQHLFGCWIGPHCITVKTTARYDCESGRPNLVKLDRYICPGP